MKGRMLRIISMAIVFVMFMGTMLSVAAGVTVTKLSFEEGSVSIEEGYQVSLRVSATPATVKASDLKWTSSNAKVATVSAGVVKALTPGNTTITASDASGKLSTKCSITVTKKADTVEIKIPVYERGNQGQAPADNSYWTKWIQQNALKDINVKVTYVAIPRYTDVDKFNMLIAAGQAPDIIFSYDYSTLIGFYGRGAYQPILKSLIDTYASHYVKTVNSSKTTNKYTMDYGLVNDKQYYMAAKRPVGAVGFVGMVRQDWLDKLKLKQPKTLDGYYKVLKAFKEKDPGNLGKDNVIPVAFNLGSVTGTNGNALWKTDEDRKDLNHALYQDLSIASLSWKPTHDQLKWFNKLYNEGLISSEFMLDKSGSQMTADIMNGKVGYFGMYMSPNPPILQTLKKNVPTVKLSPAEGFSLVENKPTPGRADFPFGMMSGINKDTSREGMIGVLKFLNWMSQDDILFTLQYGVEGKTYTKSKKDVTVNSSYTGEERLLNGTNKDYWCLVTEAIDRGSLYQNFLASKKQKQVPGFESLLTKGYYMYVRDLKKNPPGITDFIFEKPVQTVGKYQKTLQAKYESAAVKLTICKPSEFETLYESLAADYLKSGYQEVLDEKRSLYNQMKAASK